MSAELHGPSKTFLKETILSKNKIQLTLINNENISGQLLWVDASSFCVKIDSDEELVILKTAIAYYKKV